MGRAQRFDHGWGRELAQSGTPAAELESEIVHRIRTVDETTLEMIREAIADALAGRRPRWYSRGLCSVDRCEGPRELAHPPAPHDRFVHRRRNPTLCVRWTMTGPAIQRRAGEPSSRARRGLTHLRSLIGKPDDSDPLTRRASFLEKVATLFFL